MEDTNLIDLNCEHQKFCTSWYTIKVSEVGTCLAVDAWNNHKIPGMCTYIYIIMHSANYYVGAHVVYLCGSMTHPCTDAWVVFKYPR